MLLQPQRMRRRSLYQRLPQVECNPYFDAVLISNGQDNFIIWLSATSVYKCLAYQEALQRDYNYLKLEDYCPICRKLGDDRLVSDHDHAPVSMISAGLLL